MRKHFLHLRARQLDRTLGSTPSRQTAPRPQRGWLRAVREATGISAAEVARTLGTSRQLPLQLEKWEANDRITLHSLRKAANALDCDLVYALVPKSGTFEGLVESRLRKQARENVLRVEHSMALEDQASGGLEEAVEGEVKRLTAKSSPR